MKLLLLRVLSKVTIWITWVKIVRTFRMLYRIWLFNFTDKTLGLIKALWLYLRHPNVKDNLIEAEIMSKYEKNNTRQKLESRNSLGYNRFYACVWSLCLYILSIPSSKYFYKLQSILLKSFIWKMKPFGVCFLFICYLTVIIVTGKYSMKNNHNIILGT